ncbi:MAG: 2-hydroxychromene-2-carboxylate isomerase [Pseudomonadota bacterium]|nr:2-hydroxychromene-2-carboxylate isomerase [Pseudomonadota bacterium]
MTPDIEFHFDFGSPNAYLSHRVIPAIERRKGVRFVYVPVLLGGVFKLTNNTPPMDQNNGVLNKSEYQQRETNRFIAKHKIAFAWNKDFPVNTLKIMRGAVAAEMDGTLPPYVEAIYTNMWEYPKKLDETELIQCVLDKAGLDGAALMARTADQPIKDKLMANTAGSVKRGTFGSPMFFVGNEMFFGKDRLPDVEEEIAKTSQ